jgi:two-component system sensor histidine kinase BaeS
MKLSIGWRLFFAVLVSLITIVTVALFLMREKVSSSFADYALKIELDRLQEVSVAIQAQYAEQGDWTFLPKEPKQKQAWINLELLRLYQAKSRPMVEDASTPAQAAHSPKLMRRIEKPANAAAPVAPALPAAPAAPAAPVTSTVTHTQGLPPLPPPPPPPIEVPPEPPGIDAVPAIPSENGSELQNLNSRISLIDAKQNYLAGRALDSTAHGVRPLFHDAKLIGYLRVQKSSLPSDDMSKDFLQEQADTITLIVLISIGLSGLAALLLALHFRRPIHRLVDGARRLADGHFDTRLQATRSDELGELAKSFNQLAEKLALAEQSRRQWVADTSHELRTPISVLRAQLEAIQDGIRSASPENIALMLRQVLSLNKLIDELYALAKADIGTLDYQMQNLDLAQLLQEEARNFQEKIDAAQLSLTLELIAVSTEQKAAIFADGERIRQVLHNLFENSLRYTDAGGQLQIRLQRTPHQVILQWDDSAPSVPSAALSRMGERFFRVDHSRNRAYGGSGLGLALCRRILEAHQANIEFAASALGGLSITIVFDTES